MSNFAGKCPSSEIILKYFYMELDEDEMKKFESHFAKCIRCISENDYYMDFIDQIKLSARVQKELWLNANADTFSFAAAASYDNAGISEVISNDGKYLLKKIAYIDDASTSLLVVKLLDPCTAGRISVYLLSDSFTYFIGSDLCDEDNKVCFEVSSDVQLANLLITFV